MCMIGNGVLNYPNGKQSGRRDTHNGCVGGFRHKMSEYKREER